MRLIPNQCRPKTSHPRVHACGEPGLSFVASYLSTPCTQFLASTSLLSLHALYQNTFAPGAWQLLDSDGSLPARSQSRPKPRLSSGLLLVSDAPESYFQGSQTKPGHCRLWNALQPELHDFMRLPSFETPVAAPTISHLFESHCHMGLEWLFTGNICLGT